MADLGSTTMFDPKPMMVAELKARTDQLAQILAFPPTSYSNKFAEAYQIMGHLAAMPTLKDQSKRHQYGVEVLTNAARSFSPFSSDGAQFHGRVQALVADMQTFPAWYHNLTASNEDLVESYVTVTRILDAMKYLGWGGLATATPKIASGARMGLGQALERGAGVRGMVAGAAQGGRSAAVKLVTGGMASRAGIFVWVVGEAAYLALQPQQGQMGQEITRRYQEGRLSVQLYQRAFGSETPPPSRYFFKV